MRRRRAWQPNLQRSGPWICWAGMAALAWSYFATLSYAPLWVGICFLLVYFVLVFTALERTVGRAVDPVKAALVPVWGLLIVLVVTALGIVFFGW